MHENTGELSQLHEAFSEHYEQGIGHPICLTIARYHSWALDFPKTGKAAIFPPNTGIPMMEDVYANGHCIFPHYMTGKSSKLKFRSQMIKGQLYDFILSQLPQDLRNNHKFRRDANLEHDAPLSDVPFLRDRPGLMQRHDLMNQRMEERKYDNQQQQERDKKYQQYVDNNNNNHNKTLEKQGLMNPYIVDDKRNGNNMNRPRHENIDDDGYCWLDGQSINNRGYNDYDDDEINQMKAAMIGMS